MTLGFKGLMCLLMWHVLQQQVVNMGDESNDQRTATDMGPPPSYHAYDDVNISEEVSKTGIWHHLNSQPTLASAPADISQPRHRFVLRFRFISIVARRLKITENEQQADQKAKASGWL